MNDEPLRAALYTRISVKDKKADRVANQEVLLRELAASEGYEVIEVYSDDGISAADVDKTRPDFLRLIEDVKLEKYDVVLATEQSRLERQPGDYLTIVHAFSTHGVVMHLIDGGKSDLDDEDDAFLAGIKSLMNAREVSQLKKRQHRRFKGEYKKGLGGWGNRPFGFEQARKPGDRDADPETLKPDIRESEAKLIREAFAAVMAGTKLYEITKAWNDAGIRTPMAGKTRKRRGSEDELVSTGLWSTSTLGQMLRRERNAGIIRVNGAVVSSTYPQIVTPAEREALLAVLKNDRPSIRRGPKATTLLTGIIRCNCGRAMTIGHQGNAKYKYDVYRCPPNVPQTGSKHSTITRSSANQLARSAVITALLSLPAKDLPGGVQVTRLIALEVELAAVREQLEAMNKSMVEASTVPGFKAASFHAMGATLTANEELLIAERANINLQNAQAGLLVEARKHLYSGGTVSLANATEIHRELREKFDALPLNEQRDLVRTLITITVKEGSGTRRGIDRVHLVHKVALSLNPDDDEPTTAVVDQWLAALHS